MTQTGNSSVHHRGKRSGLIAFTVGVTLAFATQAQAQKPRELPKSYITLPAAPADVADEDESEDLLLDGIRAHELPTHVPLYKRYRNLKVLSFTRDLEVGKEEVRLKVQSPGGRRSLISVEVNF